MSHKSYLLFVLCNVTGLNESSSLAKIYSDVYVVCFKNVYRMSYIVGLTHLQRKP